MPNEDRHASNAATFRVFIGQSRIGHAWKARSSGDASKTYFLLKLDDPGLLNLCPADDGGTARLIWNRGRTKND